MSKSRWTMFILMNVANYVLVLFAVLFYYKGAPFLYPVMLLTQLVLALLNCLIAKKIVHLSILSVNLLLSTIISNIVDTCLYMQNISGDSETLLVGKCAIVIGSIYVIIISLIAILVKFLYNKYKKST